MPKKATAKSTTKQPAKKAQNAKPRQLKDPRYHSFRLQRRIKHPRPPLLGSFPLMRRALGILWRHKWVFLGILAVYGVLNIAFVQGLNAGADVGSVKTNISQAAQGSISSLGASLTAFGYLLSNSGNTASSATGAYQAALTVIVSLVLIWTLRQVFGGVRVGVRDGFYRGVYPLVPFVLVLCAVALQLVPLVAGVLLYNLAASNGIIVGLLEHLLWWTFVGGLALWSLYMVTSSMFALYIVCLPDMTPLKALRSARELVRFRRWAVLRRVIVLLLVLLVAALAVVLPFIIFVPAVAGWLFFVLTMFGLAALHSYMYCLYRELLQ